MDARKPFAARTGLSLVEVMIALVLLGIISMIFMQTTRFSQKNTGKSIDWQAESVVLEKTIENLRVGHTVSQLQKIDTSFVDTTQGTLRIQCKVKGSVPPSAVTNGFPPSRLAMITVTAKRTTFADSIVVSTYLWLN